MTPTAQAISLEKIKFLCKRYHWLQWDEENQELCMFMDHQMLSTLRMCEQKFVYEHVLNLRPRGHKAWSLVFGAWLHFILQEYYEYNRLNDGKLIEINKFLQYCRAKWLELNLDAYKDEDKYQDISGYDGASALAVSYYAYYHEQRMRVVATEIPFGFDKEVYLGKFWLEIEYIGIYVKCYLTGRMDLLIDNGHKVGPVDHKHTHIFRGDEWTKYNPQDGITGYIYATDAVIKKFFPDYDRVCRTGWIFHIQGKAPSVNRKTKSLNPRFKVTVIDKTDAHLLEYIKRQVETFKRALALLTLSKVPEWTTTSCHNIYNRRCEYVPVDEQDYNNREYIIKQFYHFTEQWNPLEPEKSLIVRDDVMNAVATPQIEVKPIGEQNVGTSQPEPNVSADSE